MNKKITISELSQLLSTNVSLINKKGWEDFLRIFFAQISEGLKAEGNVKIKGLGTFKVVKVDARKSKDVNTGANTVIPAHNKISFTPDSSLAETLNKPYAHFEPSYVLAPEGEVDAPEPEDDDIEVNNAKTETEEPVQTVESTIVEPVVATISNLNTEVVNQETNEKTEETVTVETPITENTTESQSTETQQIPNIISEEQSVEVENIAEAENTTTSSIVNEEVNTTESSTTNENIETSNSSSTISEEENTEEPTTEATATVTINEDTHTEETTTESSNTSSTDKIEAEKPEEETKEDSKADDDKKSDAKTEETITYASTFKRHDLPKEKEDDDENNDKNSHGKKLGIAIILFLCILFVVGLVAWMSDPNIVSKIRYKLTGNEPAKTEVMVDSSEYEETKDFEEQIIAEKTEENAEAIDSIAEATTQDTAEKTEEKPAVKQNVQKYTNFKDDFINYMKKKHPEMDITDQGDPIEEKLGNNSRLTLVSLRHYGAKDFWVYIYLYNKDVIKNPNHIKAGTKIKVPMLDNTKLVNPDSEHSILTAKEIQHEFVK